METWLKHPKDTIAKATFNHNEQLVTVLTCSRHSKDGIHQGYIVQVVDQSNTNRTFFKHYVYRSVVETYVKVMYKMGNINVA
ncbi:hypothetical protein LCGC14_0360430 [marine sediment metagenome]|uniref:Uncharacterized protein n=1 Tax=marine sediment metagenome TaxID=412755 RepID=A0A0F9TE56_9ZZZZ|nr:hypothetical protein [bacterium]